MSDLLIAGRRISAKDPPFVIAELSGNHKGDINRAIRLIDAAKAAGADAVKLQTYTADTITIDHDGPGFIIEGGLWSGRKLYELYQEAHTPWEWHPILFRYARENGMICFSSPFDTTAVDFLTTLDSPAYKIASFEIIDLPLIQYVAGTGKPIILSTGMASAEEIKRAAEVASKDRRAFALLHCVSGYPTPASDANLSRIRTLASKFQCPIGLSDHTVGTEVAIAAVGVGASIIEKHLTLARADGGPDAEFSLEPHEFAALVKGIRLAYAALGSPDFRIAGSEQSNLLLRRSIYAVCDISRGEKFTRSNIRSIRPGFGLPPSELPKILGRQASSGIARGTPLKWELIG